MTTESNRSAQCQPCCVNLTDTIRYSCVSTVTCDCGEPSGSVFDHQLLIMRQQVMSTVTTFFWLFFPPRFEWRICWRVSVARCMRAQLACTLPGHRGNTRDQPFLVGSMTKMSSVFSSNTENSMDRGGISRARRRTLRRSGMHAKGWKGGTGNTRINPVSLAHRPNPSPTPIGESEHAFKS